MAWKKYNTPSKIKNQLNKRIVFCAFEKNKLIGTIALKDDYILGFYVSYTHIKKGIGTILLSYIEKYALKKNIRKLHLTSTPSAFYFYKKKEYRLTKNIISSIHGIDYSEIEMEKDMVK
jgi:GNAT superfamily N-acetyltransferase